MNKIAIALCLLSLSFAARASTLVHNITGYTMNDGNLVRFAALEFNQGRVTRLYKTAGDMTSSKAHTRIDGQGATLLPGLTDAHGHVHNHGLLLQSVNLIGSDSEADAVQRVKSYIERQPEQTWIQGRGWNQVLWDSNAFPTRESLDALGADKFIALKRVDGHAFWVNSAVLEKAGINKNTPDPAGGQIYRDAQGKATGVLIDNAMSLVNKVVPAATDEQMSTRLHLAMTNLASYGLTGVHDAETRSQFVRVFQQLNTSNSMPIRIYAMLFILDPKNDEYLQRGPIIDPAHMLDIRSIKISADGALGSRGAALFEDYSDAPGHKGLLLLNDEQLEHHMSRAMKVGYQVNTHAIGDLTNDRVLDYYERLAKKYDAKGQRHRIEHAQIFRPDDIARVASGGFIASIQPTHATSDMNMAGDRLGDARLSGAYAWKKLLASGAHLAGGSDFPVESPNPFYGLHAAVTRQDHQNVPAGGWLPQEKLSREVALSLFTEGAAYAAHQEKVLGRLMPGYFADFILVRDDYFSVPETDIWKNKVLATYVAGKQVYNSALD
ncbi:MAG: amidohydrolase [Halioglobus sp.]